MLKCGSEEAGVIHLAQTVGLVSLCLFALSHSWYHASAGSVSSTTLILTFTSEKVEHIKSNEKHIHSPPFLSSSFSKA